MNTPLTNCHIHVFISECAPPNFLRVRSLKALKRYAEPIKWLLERQSVRELIWKFDNRIKFLPRTRRGLLRKVISFLNTGSKLSQLEIFEKSFHVANNFGTNPRLLALTLDMDYMDTESKPIINYPTQLYEVIQIKRQYPDNIFPFIGVDPRAKSGSQLVNWVTPYFENGVKSKLTGKIITFCSGFKLYPAYGFFPFDPRLDELYNYAELNRIPLMFHCTRTGSQYIGNQIESLIPSLPEMIMPEENSKFFEQAENVRKEIIDRISRFYAKGWIKNSEIGANEYACDLFSHPQNYVPVMCKYPKLKICLAHMGGAEEVENMHLNITEISEAHAGKDLKEIWKTDEYNWAGLIKELMMKYKNLYTDISSTITNLDNNQVEKNISDWLETKQNGEPLGNRILFGTDYYMTEIDKVEPELYGLIQNKFNSWFEKMATVNTENYLS